MTQTKNIGQIAGLKIGNTPPVNKAVIWYDDTPNQKVHKVYDNNLMKWVVLDQNIISSITYSELVNLATSTGLSIGQYFQIRDKANSLALSITSTKVKYTDPLGNILIDDLGSNVQYHVTSSNLQVDDVSGVFDTVNKKLVFQFEEHVPEITSDDFIFGKVKRGDIWKLAKYKLSSFISKVTGNSITWNGGFFFNFNKAIGNILDKKGGVVSKDAYDIDIDNINVSINNVGSENQSIIENADNLITEETTDQKIYGKKLTSDLSVGGSAIDIAKGDTLYTIVTKIQRWINNFKYATGVFLSQSFSPKQGGGMVNNNDSVETAFSKVQGSINKVLEKDIPDVIKKGFYDYVVDSDESLANLINNPEANTVLIKNGTWNYDFGDSINNIITLHSNTKIIHCQPNAILNITGSVDEREDGSEQGVISYEPATDNDRIKEYRGINVRLTLRGTPVGSINTFSNIFNNLENLYNCNVLHFEGAGTNCRSYNKCKNLYNCNSISNRVMDCYRNCEDLYSCTGTAFSLVFYGCKRVNQCYVLSKTKVFAFSACTDLNLCYVDISIESEQGEGNNAYAFISCKRVVNCSAKVTQSATFSYTATCFQNCSQMVNCYAESHASRNNKVFGISVCTVVRGCLVNENITVDNRYYSSYASHGGGEEYECANTPAGGFNK